MSMRCALPRPVLDRLLYFEILYAAARVTKLKVGSAFQVRDHPKLSRQFRY